MNGKAVAILFAITLLRALPPVAADPTDPANPVLQVPESVKAEGVPAIPLVRSEELLPY
jgi:hypothetical protein